MTLKLSFKPDLVKGLKAHSESAHGGKIDPNCPACIEIQKKISNPTPPPKRKIEISRLTYERPGSSASSVCKRGNHSRCSGRLSRKYGREGDKCTCSCHWKQKDVDFDEAKVISMLSKL